MFPQGHNHSGLDHMLHHHHLPHAPPPMPVLPNYPPWKPAVEVAPNCPRCASTNTKFCYYNNYSLSQPRYFCKACRRYWTKGGSLRNVPVGGGCRKTRRASKTARHHSHHRASAVGDANGSSDDSLSGGDGDDRTETSGSRDIDMAVVFAKYLNHSPGSPSQGFPDSPNNNGSSTASLVTLESGETENDAVMQPPPKDCCDVIDDGDALGLLGGAHLDDGFGGGEELIMSLSGIDELEYGFDHVVQDDDGVLWSHHNHDDAITTYWQPPPLLPPSMQLGELDEYSVAAAPPFNIAEEDIGHGGDGWVTNWSTSFDLSSAMEVFSSSSRP